MCDGQKYKAANTSRNRNILQGNVLRALGWNIYRLWILDWWESQDKELGEIKAAIENAIKDPVKVPEAEVIKMPNEKVSGFAGVANKDNVVKNRSPH